MSYFGVFSTQTNKLFYDVSLALIMQRYND